MKSFQRVKNSKIVHNALVLLVRSINYLKNANKWQRYAQSPFKGFAGFLLKNLKMENRIF